MQRRTLSVLAALAAALPLATQAETMNYSLVELGYVDGEVDTVDSDGDGFELRGSLAFHESFFAFAEYLDLGFDGGVDFTRIQVGAGGRWPINPKVDLVARFGIVQDDYKWRFGSFDEDGFTFGVKLRGEVAPRLELEGGFDYVDVDHGDDTTVSLEGRYFFLDNLSGGLKLQFGDLDTIGLGLRMTF